MNYKFDQQLDAASRVGKLFSSVAMMGLVLLTAQLANAQSFSFSTGNPDLKLGALSRPAGPGKIETETADDFNPQQTTIINRATIIGVVPAGTPLSSIKQVEVEIYHVFPLDSAIPPSGNVPSRANSPSDVEISTATRAANSGTLTFSPSVIAENVQVSNTVVNGIDKAFTNTGVFTGDEVELAITFTTPIILSPGSYFFRPEVQLTDGDFFYVSAPRPIVPPGTVVSVDRQAWIRNSNLSPDWLRIGADIIGGTTTFNMAFSLFGETVPNAGIPGQTNCNGKSISALSQQFGTIDDATVVLGFSSVTALHNGVNLFCAR
jgi:hypothetical protein